MFFGEILRGNAPLGKVVLLIYIPIIAICFFAMGLIDKNFWVIIINPGLPHTFLSKTGRYLYGLIWCFIMLMSAILLVNSKNTNSRPLKCFSFFLVAAAIIFPVRMFFLMMYALAALCLGLFSDGSM